MRRVFRWASWLVLVAWVGTTLAGLLVAAAGIGGLSGLTDFRYRLGGTIPGTDLNAQVAYQPSWGVQDGSPVCERLDIGNPDPSCSNLVVSRGGQQTDGDLVAQGDVNPVGTELAGRLFFDPGPGWNPLIASLYGMTVLSIGVLAFLLYQLWRLLRAAAGGEPFTAQVVRRLRIMGWVLVGWEVVEPLLWLFFSPKAHDYGWICFGPRGCPMPGSMEPGGPELTRIAFGLLLVLLAEVFRHGLRLADEQKLTV